MATQAPVTIVHTDEEIQTDVLEELRWDAQVRSTDIGIAVKRGIVTLTGQVDTYAVKLAAQEAAHRIRGVKAVANDIVVHLPYSAERTDADLAAAVLNTLAWDVVIPTRELEVTVSQGWVTVKGTVDFGFQRLAAEHAIHRLAGVRGVTNSIEVKVAPVPATIRQDIERALVRNAETDAQTITVVVDGSKVTLKGAVHSFAERQSAERTAWSAPGVTSVNNQITIQRAS